MKAGFIGGKFLPLHQGHVYAIIEASTRVDRLYVILTHSLTRDRELCEKDGCPYIPYQIRLRWLHELTKEHPHIIPIAIEDDQDDEHYDWKEGAKKIKKAIQEPISYIFGSEPQYKEIFTKNYPKAKYIIIDAKRETVPISATQIRQDVYNNWRYLPYFVRPFFVKKVIIVGTESCGKSTLIRNLALLYNTIHVKEHGRHLCEDEGGPAALLPESYRRILYGHKLNEHEATKQANKIVFIDTEAIITYYYAQLYSEYTDKLFDEIIKHERYDLWLFLEPDIAWVDDGQRQHGEQNIREDNNAVLKQMLRSYGITFHTIAGSYHERLNKAQHIIKEHLGVAATM